MIQCEMLFVESTRRGIESPLLEILNRLTYIPVGQCERSLKLIQRWAMLL